MVSSRHYLLETKDGAAEYSGNKDNEIYRKGFEQVAGGKAKDYKNGCWGDGWGCRKD